MSIKYLLILVPCMLSCKPKYDNMINNCSNVFFEDVNEYKHEELNFKLNLPNSYILNESHPSILLIASKQTDKSDYIESFGINVSQNLSKLKLEEIYQVSIDTDREDFNSSQEINNYNKIENGVVTINDIDSYWIIQSYEKEGNKITLLDYYLLDNDLAYKITFTANSVNFDSLYCKYLNIIRSIEFN